jgi:zinc transport system ATP-binding protein
MKFLITIEDLRVVLGDTQVLRGVNAKLERGKITALIGLNGSGKTTLLRAVLGEVPYSGKIRFHCGHDHTHPLPEQVGYVPQKLRFDAHMPLTVLDLLALARQKKPLFLGVKRKLREQLAGMLARVGSPPELLDRPFEKISGGEQQRVLLALALEPCPELLLLDEPAAGVDFKDQENFYDLIARLNSEKNVTILLVSHEISMVSRHAHHVFCMLDGKIECEGRPAEIVNREALGKTFGHDMGIFHHHHESHHNHEPHPPTITEISPTAGPRSGGTLVVISGKNLHAASQVQFGSVQAQFVVASNTTIHAVAPLAATAGPVDIVVRTADGTSEKSRADQFTYMSLTVFSKVETINHMNSTEDHLVDAQVQAETQAVMDHLISGKPLDEDTIRRVRERAKGIRQEILRRHGIVNAAVDLLREARDES